jgi:hypothetical protein
MPTRHSVPYRQQEIRALPYPAPSIGLFIYAPSICSAPPESRANMCVRLLGCRAVRKNVLLTSSILMLLRLCNAHSIRYPVDHRAAQKTTPPILGSHTIE